MAALHQTLRTFLGCASQFSHRGRQPGIVRRLSAQYFQLGQREGKRRGVGAERGDFLIERRKRRIKSGFALAECGRARAGVERLFGTFAGCFGIEQ